MGKIIFLRHLKTKIDKNKPVSEWELSPESTDVFREILRNPLLKHLDIVYTSPEKKARVTAKAICDKYNLKLIQTSSLAEVDRSKAGFIEGDYGDVVKSYFKDDNFEYGWESLGDVKRRIKKFLKKVDLERNILVVSHGMYLSILLSKCFNKNVIDYWKNLGFGEIIEVDTDLFFSCWK